jgi:hypothetical protein
MVTPYRRKAPEMRREMVWVQRKRFMGWACSQCAWEFNPSGFPTGNSIGEMKQNYERQRDMEFESHVCAGLLVRSFQRLRTIDLGFDKDRLLEVMLNPRPGGYQNLDINSYHKQLIERISNIPGIRSASFADLSVPSPQAWRDTVSVKSADALTGASVRTSEETVSPGFFATLGIRLIRGRDFAETDDDRHARFGIASRSLAERLFPNGDAIGKSVRFGVMPEFQDIQIVGIASDARILDLRDAAPPVIYVSYLQYPKWAQWGNLFVRANESPEVLAKTIGREIDSLGHEYALRTRTIEQTMCCSHVLACTD